MSQRLPSHHQSGEYRVQDSHRAGRPETRVAHRIDRFEHDLWIDRDRSARGYGDDHSRHNHTADCEPRQQKPTSHHHRRVPQTDYTLAHAGHQLRFGPIAFWTIVGTLVIMGAWSIVTATYFAFHDDVLTRLIARQAEMQFAYEDRIADMRAQVDRVTSRQLLDQEQFERKLDQLAKRQSVLESRAVGLGAAADPTVTGSIKPAARGAVEPATPKPSPISGKVIVTTPPDREARLQSRVPPAIRGGMQLQRGGIEGTITRLQESLDRVESRQTGALNALEESYERKVRGMAGVLADLGLSAGKVGRASASGGPFVPYRLAPNANAFEHQLHRISLARATAERLTRTMATVPIRKPITGDIDTTSGFGVRIDPFLGRPAMHTGLDFRGNTGDPIHATASGTVVTAGWSGGYGKTVEIDHGNNLSTRYGHLSEIDATVGQTVKIGQIIGRLGSTGRSTGPHLHYETRIGDNAVDPQKFLRAGIRLGIGS